MSENSKAAFNNSRRPVCICVSDLLDLLTVQFSDGPTVFIFISLEYLITGSSRESDGIAEDFTLKLWRIVPTLAVEKSQ